MAVCVFIIILLRLYLNAFNKYNSHTHIYQLQKQKKKRKSKSKCIWKFLIRYLYMQFLPVLAEVVVTDNSGKDYIHVEKLYNRKSSLLIDFLLFYCLVGTHCNNSKILIYFFSIYLVYGVIWILKLLKRLKFLSFKDLLLILSLSCFKMIILIRDQKIDFLIRRNNTP